MNFLAHFYLSGDSEDILVGNFLGDFVKGNDMNDYSDKVREGIIIHRAIDEFTDHHPSTGKSKELLRDKYNHYAGVIVDIFYDHFLAIHWDDYHPDPLHVFALNTYRLLSGRQSEMPKSAQLTLPYMIKYDWLTTYKKVEGIEKSLNGMSRRAAFESHMEEAGNELREYYKLFDAHFLEFFPDLVKVIAKENPYFTL